MPTFVGAIFIPANENSIIATGDLNNISPKTASKTYNGSGGSNTGLFPVTINGASATNTLDADVADQDNIATL
ncbi:spore germination protein [Bacillus sp. RG28]|uniref:Spore germination protein n=1 Tax=Gottfriedia endophytica TaxID=2820819 RepID=A0A940NPK6_9BACI|nr:spore germination protein [Gottfriedia endophytica]MBP0724556.1 spore germination protein [Gottfriedia endophytica]